MFKILRVDAQLFRGPRPPSFEDLQAHGIERVITLQSGFFEDLHDDKFETEFGLDFGIEHIHIPCSDWAAPKDHEVEKFLKATSDKSKKTYFHCLHGKDRTGFMAAVYRMVIKKWSYSEAKAEMFSLGFHKFPYLFWLPALKKWESKF